MDITGYNIFIYRRAISLFLSFLLEFSFFFFRIFLTVLVEYVIHDFRIGLLSYVKILLTLWLGLNRIYTLTHEEFKYLQHCFQVGTGHFRI